MLQSSFINRRSLYEEYTKLRLPNTIPELTALVTGHTLDNKPFEWSYPSLTRSYKLWMEWWIPRSQPCPQIPRSFTGSIFVITNHYTQLNGQLTSIYNIVQKLAAQASALRQLSLALCISTAPATACWL